MPVVIYSSNSQTWVSLIIPRNKGALFWFFVSRLLGGPACSWRKEKEKRKKNTLSTRGCTFCYDWAREQPLHARTLSVQKTFQSNNNSEYQMCYVVILGATLFQRAWLYLRRYFDIPKRGPLNTVRGCPRCHPLWCSEDSHFVFFVHLVPITSCSVFLFWPLFGNFRVISRDTEHERIFFVGPPACRWD